MIHLIAAIGNNNELGKNNDMLWHLPNDFKHFKDLTTDNYIIMGRKTLESLPNVLSNRIHIIITTQKHYCAPKGCIVVHSLEEALEITKDQANTFVIGGGEIYRLALDKADVIDLTRVDASFEDAQIFFPEIDMNQWELKHKEEHTADDKHKYNYSFETLVRK